MLIPLLLLILGLVMLIVGGDLLVRGASTMARVLGVSELVVGLTVVAFGTSAPELAVNVLAAWEDKGDISFGNIVGSNIANIGLILGIAALIRPLQIRSQVIRRELPMMLLATIAVCVMAADNWLRASAGAFDRSDGLIMLLLFGVFLYYTAAEVLYKSSPEDTIRTESAQVLDQVAPESKDRSLAVSAVMSIVGLGLLIGGGQVTVEQATMLALSFGVPQVVVGLTLVAVGTSLPELVTSVVAVYRGQSDIAVGNVIGSNIFNLLLIMGVSSAVRPIPVPAGGWFDLIWLAGLSLVLVPMVLTANQRLIRREGLFLLLAYAAYISWRVLMVLNGN